MSVNEWQKHSGTDFHIGPVFPTSGTFVQTIGSAALEGYPTTAATPGGTNTRPLYVSAALGVWVAKGTDGNEVNLESQAAAGGTHNILSATHADSTANAVSVGDFMVGTANGTNAVTWNRLPVGASGFTIRSNGTVPLWAQLAHADLSGVSADQHHAQSHTHASHTGIGVDDHHAEAHILGKTGPHSDAPTDAANGFLKRNGVNNAWEEVAYGAVANTVTQGNDARLSDARTPTAHATSHGAGGSDVLTTRWSRYFLLMGA